jgi:YggT family protein
MEALSAIATLAAVLRSVLLVGGVAVAAVATANWAVRTRRINPFGGVARFMRAQVDPRLAGIERQVTRAGGHPSATPWWALVAYVIVAALVLATLDVLFSVVREAVTASTLGSRGVLALVVHWTFRFLSFALLVRVIGSWFPRAAHSPWMRWSFAATEWMLRPLRGMLPTIGMLDITPIVAYFALQLVEWIITGAFFSSI